MDRQIAEELVRLGPPRGPRSLSPSGDRVLRKFWHLLRLSVEGDASVHRFALRCMRSDLEKIAAARTLDEWGVLDDDRLVRALELAS